MNECYSSVDKCKDKNYNYYNTNKRRWYVCLSDNANPNEIGEDRIPKERHAFTRDCGSLLLPKKSTKGICKK